MASNLPWEDEFTVDQWLDFEPRLTHIVWVELDGLYFANIGCGNAYQASGTTRNEAIVCTVKLWCSEKDVAMPFRPRPDLSTAEGCLRAITDVGGGVQIFSQRANEREPVITWRKDEAARWFGEPGEPWTLDALQAAARYVLGMEAKADE